ncbi:hypothetical protein [Streptomyces venezuelae]|uniref:hypothetical protein n=1 Tax=Streptomyces venezuelae TaxID=54571 RepID=UPI0016877850|nr:hypothetical protein [Streptomyces venezuelae]
MAEQTVTATKPTATASPAGAPRTGGFMPQVSTHPVGTLTLGSQKENDSDKEWYFE